MTRLDDWSDYQETFSLFDNRGDGKIYVNQMGDVLRAMGQNPTENDVKKCALQFESPDARIGFEQFAPVLQQVSRTRDNSAPEEFIEGFRVFDKEQNGYITSAELRHLLTSLGERMTDEEVEQLLQGHEDSQGNVRYEDFVRSIMKQ